MPRIEYDSFILNAPLPTKLCGSETAGQQLLIIGDGFDSSSEATFRGNADTFVRALGDELTYLDGAHLMDCLGVWTVMLDSAATGMLLTVPQKFDLKGNSLPFTALEAEFFGGSKAITLSGSGRAHCAIEAFALDLQKSTAVFPVYSTVRVAVILNFPLPGGLSENSSISWTTNADGFVGLLAHEWAHSFGLNDEYEDWDPNTCMRFTPGTKAVHKLNVSESGTSPPWTPDDPANLPTYPTAGKTNCKVIGKQSNKSPDFVGTFEGAGHYHCGLFRPAVKCRMRNYNHSFCSVCRKYLSWRLNPNGRSWPF